MCVHNCLNELDRQISVYYVVTKEIRSATYTVPNVKLVLSIGMCNVSYRSHF